MTDQMIDTLIQQRRIETTLDVTFAIVMLIALATGVHLVVAMLRRRPISRRIAVFAICAVLLGVVSQAARVRTERQIQQAVERAIQPNPGTSNARVPSDIVSLFR